MGIICVLLTFTKVSNFYAKCYNVYENVDYLLNEKLNLQNGGASIAIMHNGQIKYQNCYGFSDGETKEKINKNTRFNIASISKIFAVVATMILVDEEKLDIDKPICEYLPEFSMANENFKKITTRMLLSYSSGICGTFLDGYEGSEYDKNYTKKFLEFIKTQDLKFEPGSSSFYCNNSIVPIEILVEKLTGKRYIDFIKEKIFTPLDLKNTGVSLGEYLVNGGTNIAYAFEGGQNIPPLAISSYTAGGLSSTAIDLCRLGEIFCENSQTKILSKRSINEIKKIHSNIIPDKIPEQVYCLGFSKIIGEKYQDVECLSKSGVSNNHQAMLFVLPEKNIVISILISDKDYESWFSTNNELMFNVLDGVIEILN
ncbi:hypothetical protein M9Y10_037220 [Tritrichomonas musculus]|uniref:Beta-lactamase-related domain-containing protein n=1 Tax=Tritrichomonas musculus TaxID=1915356 RepID=A0ABR2GJA4_9EUKA